MPVRAQFGSIIAIAVLGARMLCAQSTNFTLEGLPVQIHGFASQAFAASSGNNYLTMDTIGGSFSFTDFGGNISVQLTPHFHVGAQLYDRNIGHFGDWHPALDWANGDYKFKDWLGIRAGKVKTVMGLFNDTQDLEFLQTWAILPQSIYPLDLRDSSIAHIGGDLYGNISLKKFGSLSYTAYAGWVPNDTNAGFVYGLEAYGIHLVSYDGRMEGGDLRWNTPLTGLLVGAAYMDQAIHGRGTSGPADLPHTERSRKNETSRFYVQYERGRLELDSECGGVSRDELIFDSTAPPEVRTNSRSCYAAASYRVSKRLQLGTYYSRFYADWRKNSKDPSNYVFAKVATARFDLTNHWEVKIEGHFMNGYAGRDDTLRGFYTQDNPRGFKPMTNLLIIRTGIDF